MVNWLKKLFNKEETAPLKGAVENKYYIEKYKDFDKIIATLYKAKDLSGKEIVIDGIVTPLKVDNRQLCSVPNDQGSKPHCAAYSICNIVEALIWKKTGHLIELDADQVYAKAKQLDKNINEDGTYLEYAIKAAIELGGFGKQSKDVKIGFLYNNKTDAAMTQLKRLLHKYDFLHTGFLIDNGWYNATNRDYVIHKGNISLGGHAVIICGYDQDGVYIQNSWSQAWGSHGFAVLPWSLAKEQLLYCCFIENFHTN